MWQPWLDQESQENVNVVQAEAEPEAGASNDNQERRSTTHLCVQAKMIVKHVHHGLVEKGCDAPIRVTSELTRVPYSTVKRIVKTADENLRRKPRKSRSLVTSLDASKMAEIRNIIYEMYRNNEVPTTASLLDRLNRRGIDINCGEETLRRCLHAVGFKYKKLNRRCKIMQSPRLITWRTEYIMKIRQYREEGRKIVYLDETWYDSHNVISRGWVDNSSYCCLDTPPSRGKRIIILNAGTENGWVPGCLLLSAKNISNSSADYHQDMDHELFEHWFRNNLLANVPPNSVIVMDNASYHSKQINKVPRKSHRKAEIVEYMKNNNLSIPPKATKAILLGIISESEVDTSKKYNVDEWAKENGHTVLRLPPYYCILNPIELVWSQLKHKVCKANQTPNLSATVIENIRKKTAKIGSSLWSTCVSHVKKIEDSFLTGAPIENIIINLNDDSDDESDDDSDREDF